MEKIKPEGKLTVITDYGEGLSKVVDGVSMDTVRKLEAENKELRDALKDSAFYIEHGELVSRHEEGLCYTSVMNQNRRVLSRRKDGE
jgi:hypothetical protein